MSTKSISRPRITDDAEIKEVVKRTAEIRLIAENMEIKSKEAQADATSLIKQIKDLKKIVKARKEFYTLPFDEILKYVRAQIKLLDDPLNIIEKELRDKLVEYQEFLEEEARKEKEKFQKKMEKAQSEGNRLPVQKPIEAEKKVQTEDATLSYKQVWKYEIEDELKIPREYLIVDTVKIGKVVKAGVRDIPGVKIYEAKETQIR